MCIIISLVACNRISSNSFKLEGLIEGAEDGETLVLYYSIQKNNEWHEIADTAKIINGKFLFEGNIEELTAAELSFGYNSYVPISVRIYLEPTIMTLRIHKSQPYAYELSGTKVEKENIELRKELEADEKIYDKGLARINNLLRQINSPIDNPAVLDSLINLFQTEKEHTGATAIKIGKTYLDFILKHNTYRIVPDLLYLLTKKELFSMDTLKTIYNNLPEQSKTSLMGKLAFNQIEYVESESEKDTDTDTSKDTLIGNPAPDFTRKDFFGKTISLSDFKNKRFVLLDFWASWCAPCIREIPKIKKLYNTYSEKGLTIISISKDEDTTKWMNAIDKYKLDQWPQILGMPNENNDGFTNDDIASVYHADAIPHFIFIDKQGKIIAIWEYLGEEQLIEMDKILNNL
jgi:thiol-disulfide isomerase/thioredoxin